MSFKMIDSEHRIVSCLVSDLPDWIVKDAAAQGKLMEDVSFFYHPGADAFVLNEGHVNFELYKSIVSLYVTEPPRIRKMIRPDSLDCKSLTVFDTLDAGLKTRESRMRRCTQ